MGKQTPAPETRAVASSLADLESPKYSTLVVCPICNRERWVRNANIKTERYTGICKHCTLARRNWRGGKRINKGHLEIFLPDHPQANGSGYIRRSHLVVPQVLREGYEVHHINGNKLDDSTQNLLVVSHTEHASLHSKTRNRRANGQFDSTK